MTASKLLVTGWVEASISCSSGGSCSDTFGLYVDGTPVPNSGHTLNAAASSSTNAFVLTTGITDTLPAGAHTVALEGAPAGSFSGFGLSYPRVQAIAVGG